MWFDEFPEQPPKKITELDYESEYNYETFKALIVVFGLADAIIRMNKLSIDTDEIQGYVNNYIERDS